jgi:NADPH-dependent 2,4-dienoyl-CoA reductase/sulfur reductase-like enzyme
VNPVAANEDRFAEKLRTKTDAPKKVVVVGGGPAGIEAACVAAMRGHHVVLFEKNRDLGGTLRIAALPYEPNEKLLRWLEGRVRRLPVTLRLGEEASSAKVGVLAPDVILVAAGAVRERSTLPGADRDHVWDGDQLREAKKKSFSKVTWND